MTLWKGLPLAIGWLALAATVGLGALTANAQKAADPAAPVTVEPDPAAAGAPATEMPAATERPAATEAPAATTEAAPAATTETAPAATTEAAPAAVEPAAAGTASLLAKDLAVGTAVFGSDGAQIGEINRVTAGPSGEVKEIHVTIGGKAGLDAQAVVVPADKIAGAGDGVKLSLSAAEVKSLPPAEGGAG